MPLRFRDPQGGPVRVGRPSGNGLQGDDANAAKIIEKRTSSLRVRLRGRRSTKALRKAAGPELTKPHAFEKHHEVCEARPDWSKATGTLDIADAGVVRTAANFIEGIELKKPASSFLKSLQKKSKKQYPAAAPNIAPVSDDPVSTDDSRRRRGVAATTRLHGIAPVLAGTSRTISPTNLEGASSSRWTRIAY